MPTLRRLSNVGSSTSSMRSRTVRECAATQSVSKTLVPVTEGWGFSSVEREGTPTKKNTDIKRISDDAQANPTSRGMRSLSTMVLDYVILTGSVLICGNYINKVCPTNNSDLHLTSMQSLLVSLDFPHSSDQILPCYFLIVLLELKHL